MTEVLLVFIAAELFFIWMRVGSIDKSTYKRIPTDGIKMMSFDPRHPSKVQDLSKKGGK